MIARVILATPDGQNLPLGARDPYVCYHIPRLEDLTWVCQLVDLRWINFKRGKNAPKFQAVYHVVGYEDREGNLVKGMVPTEQGMLHSPLYEDGICQKCWENRDSP